ncbi:MAG: hypothetical protein AAF772_12095 [Acidobacteriota bacterium]
MDSEETLYRSIAERMASAHDDVSEGRMMSRPAIQYKSKVFAFYRKQQMVFKLGVDYAPEDDGIDTWSPLAPFKTKPPLKGWYQIPPQYEARWPELAERAMQHIAAEVDGGG